MIVSAQALRLLADLAAPSPQAWFGTRRPVPRAVIETAMAESATHTRNLTRRAVRALRQIDGLTVYEPDERAPLVSFTVAGLDPMAIAEALDRRGVEARAGCHGATLAHRALGLDPPAGCRLSFALYNTTEEVDRATSAVAEIATRAYAR